MATCVNCSRKAIIKVSDSYCKEHFVRHFESTVVATVKKYKLIGKNDRVAVACSGGKDSTALLYLLHKWFGNKVTALAIDEGIAGYRSHTLKDLQAFCSKNDIPLKILSFKREFGFTLDTALKRFPGLPCSLCGTLRRYLLNKGAKGFTKIATGHNLDDEAQSIMMNLFKDNLEIAARLGPVSGVVADADFVPRVKPLYLCPEKEVAAYSYIMGFGVSFNECPYSTVSFRASVRDFLNELEEDYPDAKLNIAKSFLKLLPKLKEKYSAVSVRHCATCGEPSSNDTCKACLYVGSLKKT